MKHRIFYTLAFIMAGISGALLVSMPWFYVSEHKTINVALYIGIYSLSGVIAQPFVGVFADLFKEKYLLLSLNFIKIVGIILAITSGIDTTISLCLIPFLFSISDSQFRVLSGKILKNLFSDSINAGRHNARFFAVRELGYILGTAFSGYLIYYFGQTNTLFVLLALSVIATILPVLIHFSEHTAMKIQLNLSEVFCFPTIFRNKELRNVIMISSLVAFPLRISPLFAAPLVYQSLKGSSLLLGHMEMAWAIGAVAANLLMSRFYDDTYSDPVKSFSLFMLLISYLVLFSNIAVLAIVSYFCIGFFGQSIVLYFTDVQKLTESTRVGRVFATSNLITVIPIVLFTFIQQFADASVYVIPLIMCVSSLMLSLLISLNQNISFQKVKGKL